MKQVIVMRKDLGMRAGKMIAQGAHASLGAYLQNPNHPNVLEWLKGPFKKICVRVESEQELFDIVEEAKKAGLINQIILDAGLTEFDNVPTYTCAAIGPATDEEINPITGNLKLL